MKETNDARLPCCPYLPVTKAYYTSQLVSKAAAKLAGISSFLVAAEDETSAAVDGRRKDAPSS